MWPTNDFLRVDLSKIFIFRFKIIDYGHMLSTPQNKHYRIIRYYPLPIIPPLPPFFYPFSYIFRFISQNAPLRPRTNAFLPFSLHAKKTARLPVFRQFGRSCPLMLRAAPDFVFPDLLLFSFCAQASGYAAAEMRIRPLGWSSFKSSACFAAATCT